MQHIIGDIGGTNARFAIVENGNIIYRQQYKCGNYAGLLEAVQAYVAGLPSAISLGNAAFALAGPITGEDNFRLTNHPWQFSVSKTKQALGVKHLHMINDFHAVALSVLHLDGDTITPIGNGKVIDKANIGVIGPGTGLGVAAMIYDQAHGRYVPLSCEGGHVTMPAKTQREFEIFQWLVTYKYSHVSAERVCSGKGMANLYRALRAIDKREDLPPRMEPHIISERALSGECDLCAEILDLMMAFLGRMAGNLALTMNALGGVYLAGGILPKLGIDFVNNSKFRAEFSAKGRYKEFVANIPTFVVDDDYMALKGLKAEVEAI
jgi:glucokinase